MVEIYRVVGSDTEYIAADDEFEMTDFEVDAVYDDRFEGHLKKFEVEDLVPSGKSADEL